MSREQFRVFALLLLSTWDNTEEKGSLKLHQLRCDFGYPCGTKYSHYAKFDVRKDACLKVAGFVPGDVVEDKESTGPHSTCIGLKFNAEKKKVEMWFPGIFL